MDPTPERKERIEKLLYLIAGFEEALRMAISDEDWEFQSTLKKKKQEYYEKLRKVMYGLEE